MTDDKAIAKRSAWPTSSARSWSSRCQTRNGVRLRISVPASGHQILLCPLELEALTWQDHEFFTKLLATPHGPEEP